MYGGMGHLEYFDYIIEGISTKKKKLSEPIYLFSM